MKMVKSLLLSSAAGIVAVAGVQAADLPVKAQPVEYVKICSLYGDGFYYIPGTDTCLRFSGDVKLDFDYHVQSDSGDPCYFGLCGQNTRESFGVGGWRARNDLDVDTRLNTAYGTLRTYTRIRTTVSISQADNAFTGAAPRAFIQWMGFTFGRVKSFQDSNNLGDNGQLLSRGGQWQADSTSNGNIEVSYTTELGNGMSLYFGVGDRRTRGVTNLSTVAWANPGANPTSSLAGMTTPNAFVAFKVNQAWGRYQVSFGGNNLRANYYTGPTAGFAGCVGAFTGTTFCDHPNDTWGWSAANGLTILTPWIAPNDRFGIFGNYGQGAGAYVLGTNSTSPGLYGSGNKISLGAITDAVYVNGSGFQLTTFDSAGVFFTHWWTPAFSTSILAAHSDYKYNNTVVNSRMWCGGGGSVPQGILVPSTTSCDPGWKTNMVAVHTDWWPAAGTRFAVEVLYDKISTGFNGALVTLAKNGARPAGAYAAQDQGTVGFLFRADRQWPGGDPGENNR